MERNFLAREPGKKIKALGIIVVCISVLAILAGVIFIASANFPTRPRSPRYSDYDDSDNYTIAYEQYEKEYDKYMDEYQKQEYAISYGKIALVSGIWLLVTSLGLIFASDCIQYRNDLIKLSLKANNPKQTESSDNLDNL